MNNEVVEAKPATVSAAAFGEEVEAAAKPAKPHFSLTDPRFRAEAPRTNVRLEMVFKCCLSNKGNPYFRCPDTALGTVMVCPKNTPADLVGKCGYLTIAVLPNTEFEPSDKLEGVVMPTKPVNFVSFRDE